jgi:hypothetical protein
MRMMKLAWRLASVAVFVAVPAVWSCGGGSESDRVGIAAECTKDDDCPKVDDLQLTCLTLFKGGYCGLQGCTQDKDCPLGAACVLEGGASYCFRECIEKPECNRNRSAENEANCVGSASHLGISMSKVCVPPSSGI